MSIIADKNTVSTGPAFVPQLDADGTSYGFATAIIPSALSGHDHLINAGTIDGEYRVDVSPAPAPEDALTLDELRAYIAELSDVLQQAEAAQTAGVGR